VSDPVPETRVPEGHETAAHPPGSILGVITPREVLTLFTAGWLGGQGALTMISRVSTGGERVLGGAELAAAALWLIPKLRLAGFGAMIAVLAVAAGHQLFSHQLPGALIFYAAVTAYLAVEEGLRRGS
jgi:hypothetical protein